MCLVPLIHIPVNDAFFGVNIQVHVQVYTSINVHRLQMEWHELMLFNTV